MQDEDDNDEHSGKENEFEEGEESGSDDDHEESKGMTDGGPGDKHKKN